MNNTNEKKLELVQRILRQAIEISTNSIIDIFVDFASHVDSICVRVYLEGWEFEKNADLREQIYLDREDCIEKLNYIDKYLEKRKV